MTAVYTAEQITKALRDTARGVRDGGPYYSEPIDSTARGIAADALESLADNLENPTEPTDSPW